MNDEGVAGRIHKGGVLSGWVFSGPSAREQCQLPRGGNRSWEDKCQDTIMVHISKYLSHL